MRRRIVEKYKHFDRFEKNVEGAGDEFTAASRREKSDTNVSYTIRDVYKTDRGRRV